MATIRERRPGVWEVRVFTGRGPNGKPTQTSRTVRGGKHDARRVANDLERTGNRSAPAGRTVADALDAWIAQNLPTWAASSTRDQQSRVRAIKHDPIVRVPLARLSVSDVERWHARLRKAGRQDAGARSPSTPTPSSVSPAAVAAIHVWVMRSRWSSKPHANGGASPISALHTLTLVTRGGRDALPGVMGQASAALRRNFAGRGS